MRYIIQELDSGSTEWKTIDSLSSKNKAKFYLKEYQAYKPNSQFKLIEKS